MNSFAYQPQPLSVMSMYEEKFGEFPPVGVMKTAADLWKFQILEEILQKAINNNQPIKDWEDCVIYLHNS